MKLGICYGAKQKFWLLNLLWILLFAENLMAQQPPADTCDRISLRGKWYFALDLADEGIQKKWYLGNLKDQYLGNVLFDPKTMGGKEFVPNLSDEIMLPNTTDLAGWGLPDQSPWINYLQRKHKFIGASWFQKIVNIPKEWNGFDVELYLERVKWESRVWVDGIQLPDVQDGLVTAHRHLIRDLKPGKHLISIRIDNRMIYPIGDKGHNYSEQTESIWNGIVGKIELRRKSKVTIDQIRLFTDTKEKTLLVKLQTSNAEIDTAVRTIQVKIGNKTTGYSQAFVEKLCLPPGKTEQNILLRPKEVMLWDEYHPTLYYASVAMENGHQYDRLDTVTFGYRDIKHSRYKIEVNGKPTFIRGNQEALGFPQTGHPPMDVATWKKIFQIYKDYGLNQVRFHSSCPPDAAFQAADELGIYVMVELVWMTSVNAKTNLRPISATTGIPKGLGNGDRTIDTFVKAETKRLLDQFGNHPSFVFFAFGNELDNINKDTVNKWIGDFKAYDNRRLYAGSTARAVLPNDDFQDSHLVPGKGYVVNADDYSNLTNYDKAYQETSLPVIAHELGQYPVYPSWKEIDKYRNTPFRFINLEKAKQLAIKNGLEKQDSLFRVVSGATQQLLYKSEIERQFRSPHSAGFNILQMNDYTGQGEALVGWLDAFYDSKGITTPIIFRQFCNDFVILSEFPKRIYTTEDTLNVIVKVHTSNASIKVARISWSLVDSKGKAVASGMFGSKNLKLSEPVFIGNIHYPLKNIKSADEYHLVVTTDDKIYKNNWELWVYPAHHEAIERKDILVTRNLVQAKAALQRGEKVLLVADSLGSTENKDYAGFKPVFWSTLFFPGRGSKTLGTYVNNLHPIFKDFPTENYAGWQWREICENGRGFVLGQEDSSLELITQPINDFHFNQKLMTMMEAKVGEGRLIICGYDLVSDPKNRIAAKQLLLSTLNYMQSANFNPKQQLSLAWLDKKFSNIQNNNTAFTSAYYKNITVDLPPEVFLSERGKGVFEFHTNLTTLGKIKLSLSRSGQAGQKEISISVDGRETKIQLDNQRLRDIELQFFREDFDDQNLELKISNAEEIDVNSIQMVTEN